jgi:hypothetical protein
LSLRNLRRTTQRLRLDQVAVCVPVERELHLEPLRRERRDLRARGVGRDWPGGLLPVVHINMRQRMLFSTFTSMFLNF